MRVRAEINLPYMPAGTEHDVDMSDPWIAALVDGGLLSQLDRPLPVFCYCCDPPTGWDTADGRDVHVSIVHEGVGGCDGVSERDGTGSGD